MAAIDGELHRYAVRASEAYVTLSRQLTESTDPEIVSDTRVARRTAAEVLTVIGLAQVERFDPSHRRRVRKYVVEIARSRRV